MRVTNGIPLGSSLLLPVGTVSSVQNTINCVQNTEGNGRTDSNPIPNPNPNPNHQFRPNTAGKAYNQQENAPTGGRGRTAPQR
jgi:hypothetical protein